MDTVSTVDLTITVMTIAAIWGWTKYLLLKRSLKRAAVKEKTDA